jgi:hypothetical protein
MREDARVRNCSLYVYDISFSVIEARLFESLNLIHVCQYALFVKQDIMLYIRLFHDEFFLMLKTI